MKAIIFYAKYGGGHLSTANAINETIINEYPEVEVKMIDVMEYINKAINKLSTGAYKEMARKAPKMWGKVYSNSNKGIISGVSKTSNRLFAIKLNHLIKREKPDIIISTHPFSTQMCAFLKKHKKINVKIANVLTDYKSHKQWLVNHPYVDYVFVANENMKEEVIERHIYKDKVYAFGIPILQKFSKQYNKEEAIQEFGLKENKKTILFFAGGKYGLATKSVYEFIEIFAKEFKDLQVIAISGQNEKIFNKFNEIVEKYNAKENIKIIEFTDKIPELMSIADVVITKPRRSNNIRKHGNAEFQ